MICCKIIAEYANKSGKCSLLMNRLSQHGDVLWEGDSESLFFGDTVSCNMTEKKIINIVKKCGYTKVYVDIFTEENPPRETESTNGWIFDKLTRINYIIYERENQKMLRDTMIGLDMLNEEIDRLRNESAEKNTDSRVRRKTNAR